MIKAKMSIKKIIVSALSIVLVLSMFLSSFGGVVEQTASAATKQTNVTALEQEVMNNGAIWPRTNYCKGKNCGHMSPKVFPTLDAAAIDWAKTYSPNAMVSGKEYGSSIYFLGPGRYSYTIPEIGEKDSVYPSSGCYNTLPTDAAIHNHPMRAVSFGNEEKLSGGDMGYAIWTKRWEENAKFNTWIYVATPEGKLKKDMPTKSENYYYGFWFTQFGYLFEKDTTVTDSIPHDRRANTQVFRFQHWFGKKCSNCVQKLAR